MTKPLPYYITTAIFYPNDRPHIGHAYEAIATDALARFMALSGRDVYFSTGTDEHGLKMLQAAQKQKCSPRALADQNVVYFQKMVTELRCRHDLFIRTSSPAHYKAAQALWERMTQAGDIYKDVYAGWYSVRDEAYYNEDETRLGDDGVRYGPQNTSVEWIEEESYFFRLSRYQDALLSHYEKYPDFIAPKGRRAEVLRFVASGLRDLSISRSALSWGIPVPGDPKHVMYVWVDALANYLTALGFPEKNHPLWRYWPAQLHVIGKDILRFHAVYWPAFLLSAQLALPERIFAHGFLFHRGEKMSKSLGNVIDPFDLVKDYGVDPVRYFFLREIPFGRDGQYDHQSIVQRANADLANDLGNLLQRCLSLVHKYCDQRIPIPEDTLQEEDLTLLHAADALHEKCTHLMEKQALHKALACIWEVILLANRYISQQEPWALRRTNPARMHSVLYSVLEVLRQIGILTQAFMPDSAERILTLLSVPQNARSFACLGKKGRLPPEASLPPPEPVFPRLVLLEPDTA